MALTRTFEIENITPEELAQVFCGMFDSDQARFFSEVGRIAATWPGAGWCQQCCSMSQYFDRQATETILKLGEYAADPYVSPARTKEAE